MKKLMLSLTALMFAVTLSAQTVTVDNPYNGNGFSASIRKSGDKWYPYFTRHSGHDGGISINYQVYSSSGDALYLHGVATLSEANPGDRGTVGDESPVYIRITGVNPYGGGSSSSTSGSSSSASRSSGGGGSYGGGSAGGVTWATSNVGRPGTFVDNPEDFGGYYTFAEAQRVCPQGWRLPIPAEIDNLVMYGGSEWTTNGRLFNNGDNTIFIPASGVYSAVGGSIMDLGLRGLYWSSAVWNEYPENALSLNLDSKHVYRAASPQKARGSVRCVQD